MTGARARSIEMRRASPGLTASNDRAFARLCGALVACILATFCVGIVPWQPAFGQAQTSLEQIIKTPKVELLRANAVASRRAGL